MAAAPDCPRKAGIMNALRTVVEQIAIVNSRLLEMAARSDTAAIEDLQQELRGARVKKDSLLEDYKQHVRTHGC